MREWGAKGRRPNLKPLVVVLLAEVRFTSVEGMADIKRKRIPLPWSTVRAIHSSPVCLLNKLMPACAGGDLLTDYLLSSGGVAKHGGVVSRPNYYLPLVAPAALGVLHHNVL